MSFALLAPLGLASLAALALPLVIHLVRRIELRTTEFAALRWISERIRPRRRLRFERPWLLLLRLALLALLAALLAKPVALTPSGQVSDRVLVAPGSDIGAARSSVARARADWRWLAPGFPSIETAPPTGVVPIASLLREADASLPPDAKLAVVVPEHVAGLDGERPQISRDVEWHVVSGRMSMAETAASHDAVSLAVRYAAASQTAVRYLRAAVAALDAHDPNRYALDAQSQDVALSGNTRALVWLGAPLTPAISAWIESGGTAIVDAANDDAATPLWRDASGHVLARVESRGRGRLITLSAPLAPSTFPALLDADFPQHLARLLQGDAIEPTRATADALRPTASSTMSAARAAAGSSKPLDPWLGLAIALLFAAERFVATRAPVQA